MNGEFYHGIGMAELVVSRIMTPLLLQRGLGFQSIRPTIC